MSNRLMIFLLGLELAVLLVPPLMSWDKTRRSFVLAVRSLWLHKLRALLSVLGIVIGTAAVIALMAFGEGSMQDALEDIKRQGATNVIVRSFKPPDEGNTSRRSMVAIYGLTYDDYERFLTIPDVVRWVPMRVFPNEVRYLERMMIGRVVATTPEYADVHKIDLVAGRFLTNEDDMKMNNYVVLGSELADGLFPFDDPLGHTVVLNKQDYKVIGVLKDRMPTGGSGGSQAAEDFNRDVYMPLSTCRVRYGDKIYLRQSGSRSGEQVQLHQATLTVSDVDKVRPTGDLIKELLEKYHLKKDWAVTVPLDRLEAAEREKDRFTQLLVLIASISLVVGGIGIMNIMLATVTERTREIGIRRALGGKRRDITLQFLVEAVVQTTIGGIVGVVLGLGTVYALPWAAQFFASTHLPAKLHVPSIFLSLGVSIGVGVLFGWYPAQRASLLDPIEALRHE
ncbi:MAG TPA: ABC transporter permease [Gemmataceae bacterium]|jgi:putative ABC transport system permease protein|nr:ABC transporter permease [Gemmataceae bacterium]